MRESERNCRNTDRKEEKDRVQRKKKRNGGERGAECLLSSLWASMRDKNANIGTIEEDLLDVRLEKTVRRVSKNRKG